MNAFVPKAEWLNDGKRTDETQNVDDFGKKRFGKRIFCWKRSGNENDVYFPMRGVCDLWKHVDLSCFALGPLGRMYTI